jgi:hypothetical protein
MEMLARVETGRHHARSETGYHSGTQASEDCRDRATSAAALEQRPLDDGCQERPALEGGTGGGAERG